MYYIGDYLRGNTFVHDQPNQLQYPSQPADHPVKSRIQCSQAFELGPRMWFQSNVANKIVAVCAPTTVVATSMAVCLWSTSPGSHHSNRLNAPSGCQSQHWTMLLIAPAIPYEIVGDTTFWLICLFVVVFVLLFAICLLFACVYSLLVTIRCFAHWRYRIANDGMDFFVFIILLLVLFSIFCFFFFSCLFVCLLIFLNSAVIWWRSVKHAFCVEKWTKSNWERSIGRNSLEQIRY